MKAGDYTETWGELKWIERELEYNFFFSKM